jgi:hypothetical protein
VREFVIRNQDKLLFATDRVGEGVANYEDELRYWETDQPTRTFYLNAQSRGLELPAEVLEKLYYRNALRAFCSADSLARPPSRTLEPARRTPLGRRSFEPSATRPDHKRAR